VVLLVLAFWLPGLVFGAAVRLRGWALAAAAPVLTFGLVAVGTFVLGKLNIRWGWGAFAGWVLAVSVVGFGIAWLIARRAARATDEGADEPADEPVSRLQHLLVGGGVLVGMAVGAVTFLRGIGNLELVNQDWDAPFHGNLVRWIAEHGSALPSTIGTISNQPGNTGFFYPDAYHALLALLLDQGGLDMPHLLNLAALMGVLAWPLGIAALAMAWRLPPVAAAAAAAVSTWFTPFPYDSLWRGPLYPYVAGIAMLPAVLALTKLLLARRGGATGPLTVALAGVGLAGLHTSLAFVFAALMLVLLLFGAVRLERIEWRAVALRLVVTAVLAAVLAAPLLLPSVGSASGVTAQVWPSEATPAAAFTQMITFSGVQAYPLWLLGLTSFIGIALMVRHRIMLWFVGAYAVFGVLYAVTVSLEGNLIQTLTGIFYNDHWRLAALLPLFGAIGFGVFAWRTAEWLTARTRRLSVVAYGTAVVLACGLLTRGGYIGHNDQRLAISYSDGPAVSMAERAGYTWLAQHVRPGETVLNDFRDGSVWMYALAGVQPAEWTYYGSAPDSTSSYLLAHLNQVDRDPKVRTSLATLRIRYVFVGSGMVRDYKMASGFANLATVKGFNKVFENSGAVVYQVDSIWEGNT
jgi:hypothetical protein